MTSHFHAHTRTQLDRIIAEQPQSILLSGPLGVGLSGAIQHIADGLNTKVIPVFPEKNEKVDIENGTITVAVIRRLYDLTKSVETNRRLIVIDQAEKMGIEAQNAFLKLLEEPSANTHFLLATHSTAKLLPTILSRVQHLELKRLSDQQSEQILNELGVMDAQKRAQLLFIARGLPAELARLATDDTYFAARGAIVKDARTYITGTAYEKLRVAHNYKDDRPKTLILLQDAMHLLEMSLQAGKGEQLKLLDQLLKIHQQIEANGNIRLQLATVV